MTTRSHETIRVGLRRIIRDPSASVNERLQATKLLMQVEGLMGVVKRKDKRANEKGLRELYEAMKQAEKREPVRVLPELPEFPEYEYPEYPDT